MENLLKTKGNAENEPSTVPIDIANSSRMDLDSSLQHLAIPEGQAGTIQAHNVDTSVEAMRAPSSLSESHPPTDAGNPFEMIGLGLEEPLPPQEAINEL